MDNTLKLAAEKVYELAEHYIRRRDGWVAKAAELALALPALKTALDGPVSTDDFISSAPDPLAAASDRLDSLTEAAKPLIKWLNENEHPHTMVLVTNDSAELFEGKLCARTMEFLRD